MFKWPADHSGLMPDALTTLPHFSTSAAIYAPKSAGVKTIGVVATPASRAFTAGLTNPALISRLSRSMTSGGVPRATPTPHHEFAYPATVSAMVGTSGSASDRAFPATASARNVPDRIWASDPVSTSSPTCTCPPLRSATMAAPPR